MSDPIEEAVFRSVTEVNQSLPPGLRLRRERVAALTGDDKEIDSLGLITLLAAVEKHVAEVTGVTVKLATDVAFFEDGNPLESLGALIDCIARLVDGTVGGKA